MDDDDETVTIADNAPDGETKTLIEDAAISTLKVALFTY